MYNSIYKICICCLVRRSHVCECEHTTSTTMGIGYTNAVAVQRCWSRTRSYGMSAMYDTDWSSNHTRAPTQSRFLRTQTCRLGPERADAGVDTAMNDHVPSLFTGSPHDAKKDRLPPFRRSC